MSDKADWCIVRYNNADYDYDDDGNKIHPKRPYDLLIFREYQWEPQGKHYPHKWEYLAKGFKSNEDALQWVSLFKE